MWDGMRWQTRNEVALMLGRRPASICGLGLSNAGSVPDDGCIVEQPLPAKLGSASGKLRVPTAGLGSLPPRTPV